MLTFKRLRQRRHTKKGDTLVEVALALGVLAALVTAVVITMTNTLSFSEYSLEDTMARNEIDVQAEALRYIHNAYAAQHMLNNDQQEYRLVWDSIVKLAVPPADIPTLNDVNDCGSFYSADLNVANPRSLYTGKSFIINTHFLGTKYSSNPKEIPNIVIGSHINDLNDNAEHNANLIAASKFQPATIYPRILYGTRSINQNTGQYETTTTLDQAFAQDESYEGSADSIVNESLMSAEGIWISVACGDGFQGNSCPSGINTQVSYYDFYFRTCWESPKDHAANTISSIIRLHNPDYGTGNDEGVVIGSYVPSITYYLGNGQQLADESASSDIDNTSSYSFTLKDHSIIPTAYRNVNSDGWKFIGWCVSSGTDFNPCNNINTITILAPGDTITASAASPHFSATAVYVKDYTIQYRSGIINASNMPTPNPTEGQCRTIAISDNNCTVTISPTTPKSNNKSFIEWSGNDGTTYKFGEGNNNSISFNSNGSSASITLTAKWGSPTTAQLVFEKNTTDSVSNFPSTKSCAYDANLSCTINLPNNPPIRNGYVFTGWSRNPEGTQVICAPNSACSVPISHINTNDSSNNGDTLTLYATWHPDRAYIRYQKNTTASVTNFPSDQSCLYDANLRCEIALPGNPPLRQGQVFVGWSKNPEGTDIICPRGLPCRISLSYRYNEQNTDEMTLYAIWHSAYMQDMDQAFCLSAAFDSDQNVPLIDRRDNHTYSVRRDHSSGRCWMNQNIAYNKNSIAKQTSTYSSSDPTSPGHYYIRSNASRVCSENLNWSLPSYTDSRNAAFGNLSLSGYYYHYWQREIVGYYYPDPEPVYDRFTGELLYYYYPDPEPRYDWVEHFEQRGIDSAFFWLSSSSPNSYFVLAYSGVSQPPYYIDYDPLPNGYTLPSGYSFPNGYPLPSDYATEAALHIRCVYKGN